MSTIVVPASSGSFTQAPGFGSLTHPENAYAVDEDGVFADAFGSPFSRFGFANIGSDLVPDGVFVSEVRVVFSAAKDGPASQYMVQAVYEDGGTWYGDNSAGFSESSQTEHVLTYNSMDLATLRGRTFGAEFGATGAGWGSTHTYIDFVRLEVDFEVQQPPVADFWQDQSTGLAPLAVQFWDNSYDNFGNPPTSWLWDFGDGNTSTDQNPTHEYDSVGSFAVSLTATNAGGSDTKTVADCVQVVPPAKPTAAFVVFFNERTINSRINVNVNDTSDSYPSATAWLWDIDGETYTDSYLYLNFAPGVHRVSMTVTNDIGSDTVVRWVTVAALLDHDPTPPPSPTPPTPHRKRRRIDWEGADMGFPDPSKVYVDQLGNAWPEYDPTDPR